LTSFHLLIACLYLATSLQSIKRIIFYKKRYTSRTPALKKNPQVKGIITKVVTMSPKKPNSAIRHVAKVNLNNKLRVTARIPGIGYICSKYNRVLVNGGRANDLPGVGYSLVRGVYDFSPVIAKKKRRSVYGTSRPEGLTKFVRRSLRLYK
jgi:small subunit ribosomal protein S12